MARVAAVGIVLLGLGGLVAGCGGSGDGTTVRKPMRSRGSTSLRRPAASSPAASARVPARTIVAANRSVAPITCDDRSGQLEFQGTAFDVVGGNAITASHVVSGCGVGALISLGAPTASVIRDDPTHDLALLSVGAESGHEPPALSPESAAPYVGEQVAMLGLNGGEERRAEVAFGHVIGVGKTARLESAGGLRETLTDVILVRASGVLPGESGGPAIDAAGKVVGVIEGSGNGLVDLTPAADLPTSGTPGQSLPALIAGGWVGTRPSQVEFSADSGNIVTGIKWSSWTRTGAVGEGTSGIQKCVPTCAAGTIDYVPTQIVLAEPQGGHFTELTEARNGHRTVARYRSAGWPLGAS